MDIMLPHIYLLMYLFSAKAGVLTLTLTDYHVTKGNNVFFNFFFQKKYFIYKLNTENVKFSISHTFFFLSFHYITRTHYQNGKRPVSLLF